MEAFGMTRKTIFLCVTLPVAVVLAVMIAGMIITWTPTPWPDTDLTRWYEWKMGS